MGEWVMHALRALDGGNLAVGGKADQFKLPRCSYLAGDKWVVKYLLISKLISKFVKNLF
jgi:hypothetical protein